MFFPGSSASSLGPCDSCDWLQLCCDSVLDERKENACKMTFGVCLSRPGICGLLLPVTSSSDGHDVSKKLFWHFTSAV